MSFSEYKEIVIVGGGICGLATALALHRKGLNSVVLERADSLRATGSGINIYTNGWRALDQLGLGTKLRLTAIPIQAAREISLNSSSSQEIPLKGEELRCLKRSDLIKALANDLPLGTIRFGCKILAMTTDPVTSYPILQLHDGSVIKAKVLIGCDGVKSVIAESIGLKATSVYNTCGVLGFTNYPDGHGFSNEFIRMGSDHVKLGRIPVNDKLIYWFVGRPWTPQDSRVSKDPVLIRESTVESMKDFPIEMVEMIQNSDLDSLTLTRLRYRKPWEILLGTFRKGTVTVAGDAMHVMGPFLGQGGSAGLEDAVVLARCLAQEMRVVAPEQREHKQVMQERVGVAFDRYLKERRARLVKLSAQTYLIGMLIQTSTPLMKMVFIIFLIIFFDNSHGHAHYDCGRL